MGGLLLLEAASLGTSRLHLPWPVAPLTVPPLVLFGSHRLPRTQMRRTFSLVCLRLGEARRSPSGLTMDSLGDAVAARLLAV